MDFTELNVTFETRHERVVLDLFNYVCSTAGNHNLSAVTSIGALRDGSHLIHVISIYEKHTRWQSSRVIDLYFKYKNDAINGYAFINGWLDTYYNCGHIIAGDGLRFASEQLVMTVAVLVANVLHSRRQSLTNDLKVRLDAVWIDLNSVADWIMLWIRTRAQLIASDTTLHSCAHQLFSGHSLYEYQAIQQRLTLMVQQKLINEQNKKLEEQELVIKQHAIDYSKLRATLVGIEGEVDSVQKNRMLLQEELNKEKDGNKALRDTNAKLEAENKELKKLLERRGNDYTEQNNNNTLFGDAFVNKVSPEVSANDSEDALSDECIDASRIDLKHHFIANHCNIYSHFNGSSTFKCNNTNNIDSKLSDAIIGANNSGLDIDCNLVDEKRRSNATNNNNDTNITHHSSTEDINDSGNHSDATNDDLLVDIYQCSSNSPKDSQQSLLQVKEDSSAAEPLPSRSLFNFNSWHEFFAAHDDSNSGGNNNDNSEDDHHFDNNNPNNDTYKSNNNQHFGTNSDICINFI